jgi:hypothetical protein
LAHEAGSCGDEKSPQFIVENRAVILEYARESVEAHRQGQKKWNGEDRPKKESGKSDWLCEQVPLSFRCPFLPFFSVTVKISLDVLHVTVVEI